MGRTKNKIKAKKANKNTSESAAEGGRTGAGHKGG